MLKATQKASLTKKIEAFLQNPAKLDPTYLKLFDHLLHTCEKLIQHSAELKTKYQTKSIHEMNMLEIKSDFTQIQDLINALFEYNNNNVDLSTLLIMISLNPFDEENRLQYFEKLEPFVLFPNVFKNVRNIEYAENYTFIRKYFLKFDYSCVDYLLAMLEKIAKMVIPSLSTPDLEEDIFQSRYTHIIRDYITALPNLLQNYITEINPCLVYHDYPDSARSIIDYCEDLSYLVVLVELSEANHPIYAQYETLCYDFNDEQDREGISEKQLIKIVNKIYLFLDSILKLEENLYKIKLA